MKFQQYAKLILAWGMLPGTLSLPAQPQRFHHPPMQQSASDD